jgi:hypothetical protein
MLSADFKLQLSGNNKRMAKNGIYEFDSITFIAEPMYETQIIISSNALDTEKIAMIKGNLSEDNGKFASRIIDIIMLLELNVPLRFRDCIQGEIVKDKKCFKCLRGTYSYGLGTKSCQKCFDHARCLGGSEVEVDIGFWRPTNTSTTV